ncbi:MAG TPA: glycosyl hydrolase 53 family protein [Bacteroidota bacterium]|nr:glycosyl hydrolase 53 family protein [Bacteroidota bacterium]
MKNFTIRPPQSYVAIFIIFFFALLDVRDARAQFAYGADIGWLSQMEASHVVFKDNAGVQKNCMEVLKEKGINALRFRVWVNPSPAYCGKEDVAYMAHRADSMGFKVMLDFHMSDTWADPGHQTKPAAWAHDSVSQLLADIYNHVRDVLDTLKSLGVTPAWVQIGNETNDGMLWPDGQVSKGHIENFAAMIQSGYNAVKSVDSSIQVIVHLANGHDDGSFRQMFDNLKFFGTHWDIIGMSVYPYWANLPWAEDDSLALITMNDMIARYSTKVMVVEAGYLYNQAVPANAYLLDLIAKTKSAGGLGVFYWEPESYNWQGYQLGAWDPATKEPTVAMNAFLGLGPTSVHGTTELPHLDFNIYPNPFNPSTNIQYSLPQREKVVIKIYDTLGQPVQTIVDATEEAGLHTVVWSGKTINGRPAASGDYFVSFSHDGSVQVHKITLLK